MVKILQNKLLTEERNSPVYLYFALIKLLTQASSFLNSNHREVNRQYYPTEQLRQSNAIKKNDSTHKA